MGHSLRDLDRGEGAALHAPHLFEETIDWSEPLRESSLHSHYSNDTHVMLALAVIELPPEDSSHPRLVRGSASQEKTTQEEREQTALSAVYMSPGQIPESPAEPTTVIPEEDVDKPAKVMCVGPELDTLFQWGMPMELAPTAASVQELVQQLAMGSIMEASAGGQAPIDMAGQANAALNAVQGMLPQDQLQQLLQQLSSTASAAATTTATAPQAQTAYGQPPYGGAGEGGWPPAAAPGAFDYGYHEDGAADQQRGWSDGGRGRGRGGRGRGRGRGDDGGYRPYIKRKPCSFFAAGRRALNLNFPCVDNERCD